MQFCLCILKMDQRNRCPDITFNAVRYRDVRQDDAQSEQNLALALALALALKREWRPSRLSVHISRGVRGD